MPTRIRLPSFVRRIAMRFSLLPLLATLAISPASRPVDRTGPSAACAHLPAPPANAGRRQRQPLARRDAPRRRAHGSTRRSPVAWQPDGRSGVRSALMPSPRRANRATIPGPAHSCEPGNRGARHGPQRAGRRRSGFEDSRIAPPEAFWTPPRSLPGASREFRFVASTPRSLALLGRSRIDARVPGLRRRRATRRRIGRRSAAQRGQHASA